jgi:intracellular septation protein A
MLSVGMEKFRIGLYGFAQVTAIAYGVLATGATVKFNRYWIDQGYDMPDGYYRAIFYRDHGYFLLLLVVAWAIATAWYSSQWAEWKIGERTISLSGVALAILFAVIGTYFAINGAQEPPHHF